LLIEYWSKVAILGPVKPECSGVAFRLKALKLMKLLGNYEVNSTQMRQESNFCGPPAGH